MENEKIAIIGVGCRFPGNVNSAKALWDLLIEGREAVVEVPPDRWNIEHFYDEEPGIAGKSMAKRGGFLSSIDQFDPQFFGISPREAPYVDPQQRLLLECAWEAIEDAGVILDLENGTDIGVFVGISHNDYQAIQGTPWDHSGISSHSPIGSAHSIAANRISYCLNLRGPSVALDTACSSALTAVHIACEHLWAGRGRSAMAGGVTIMITPGGFIGFSQASMLSSEGRCKAFDASADGFVRGEGAGMILLKRLSDAIADGDTIHGVIAASAMNQDGHTNGISLPSAQAQARLVRDACAQFSIDPLRIGFVEAHGTGTAVGDPIEAHALAEALCENRPSDSPLPIGSVKTNLGHLETAAGVAGLLKAMLILKNAQIPPSLHFTKPSPHIDFENLKLRVPTKLEEFPVGSQPRMAGVNSFGFGGANSHVILEEPPVEKAPEPIALSEAERPWPLVVSARSEKALKTNAAQLAAWIEEHMRSNGHHALLPDLTYTLGARRNHHPFRLTLVATSTEEAIRELTAFSQEQAAERIRTSFSPRLERDPRIGFVMSGQGPQWWGMGRELMKHEPVFRRTMEAAARALEPWTRFSLLEELGRDEATSRLSRTEIAQPAIFAMQVALAELWKSWGVKPTAIVGHSVGEIAASCVAGILTLEEAARVIALRSRYMDECARGEGTMLAVAIDEETARELIARHDRTVTIAAFNGPKSLTLAGPKISLDPIAAELEAQGVFARFVRVDHPFHHPLMRPAAAELEETLADLVPHAESVPFYSTVTGARCSGTDCGATHWANGVRQPVMFAPALAAMAAEEVDVWLEIGAHPALGMAIQECLAAAGTKAPVVATARREREHETVLEAAMELHRASVPVDFSALTPGQTLLSLPAYSWDHSRWWHESADWRESRMGPGGRGLLDIRLLRATPTWVTRIDGRHMAFLKDHKVDNHIVFPAAGFVDMALEAGLQLFEGRSFIIEDFEIRRPLILPENPGAVLLELNFEPDTRTFSIQSRQGSAWSNHVVGSMRGERTDSSFAASTWNADPQLEKLDPDNIYAHLSEMGLRYGEEFRGVRELAASNGRSTGRVALAKESAKRGAQYPLHPVLLDAALHIFSAGAATVEGRGSRMKLPVRFARIQYLRSPGDSSLVKARVTQFNDELVEGDVELYTADGRPSVLVEGFRAVSLAAARRAGGSGGQRDLIYHVDWHRLPAATRSLSVPPPSLEELHAAATAALDGVMLVRGRERLTAGLTEKDDLAASQLAEAFFKMGAGEPFTAESLGVVPAMQPVFQRLIGDLAKRGLFVADGEGWKPTPALAEAAAAAPAVLGEFLARHAGNLVEGQLCALMCADMGPILRGEKDAVQVLFGLGGAELLDQFYGDGLFSSHWMAAISAAVLKLADSLPEGRGLRILEVGAGTGALAAFLLPLLERGLHRYVFTDVSQGFFNPAMQKLSTFPEVEYQVFDLERSGAEQGLTGEFDLVLGTNVLHTVADIRATLKNVSDLLVPGGTLIFTDVANSQLWTETVFGLASGWWRFTDRDLRPDQPLLTRAEWEKVLTEQGFDSTASIPGMVGPRGESQMAMLARKPWQDAAPATTGAAVPEEKSWLVFEDAAGLGEQVVTHLRSLGARCRVVRPGAKFAGSGDEITVRPEAAEDWKELIASVITADAPTRLLWLWSLDAPRDRVLLGTDALLHLTQAIETVLPAARLRFDLVTRGAQPGNGEPLNVEQAATIGEFRVMLSEHPHMSCHALDLPAAASLSDFSLLWQELTAAAPEREVVLREEARYVPRITRGLPTVDRPLAPGTALRLESRERGTLDSLRLTPFSAPTPGPGEVLIEVAAAGMNFRDVLKALALYPAESPDARMFGDEVGGVVRAVGAGVTHVAPGDRVFGIAAFGLATLALSRGGDVRAIPDGLTFEEAATLPVVFMTAWHSIQNVARMRRGEWILVHAGAGGVGMAAIQIAQHLGIEVIATAGSASKRALLRHLGVKHVIDSRKGDFKDEVMRITNRRGVDAVLNSLAGEAIPMGMACLAEFGRFIEIGKRDIYQNSRIPLWPMRNNASFHVVAMDAVFNGDEELTRNLLAEIASLVEAGALRPLPFRSFPACRVDAAFRYMAQGKHIGKIVITFAPPFLPRRGKPVAPVFTVRPDGAYLITGAFGGFGKVIANWLVECGARHLVLVSRSGASTPEAETFVASLQERGVKADVVKADIGSEEDVIRLFEGLKQSTNSLRGIYHLAMVIDDAPMGALTAGRMASVLAPKAHGAWLLHEHSRDLPLEQFVLFSSVSSIFGNPAQANYAAANAFLDALAHHRQALGLPALAVNWGVLGGEGYVARNERVAEFLARQGTSSLTPGEVVRLLETFLSEGTPQASAIRVDWAKWRQSFRGLQENPLIERIVDNTAEDGESGRTGEDWRQRLSAAAPGEKVEVISQAVRTIIGSVLRVKPESLRDDQPLSDLGLDSLMGAEIETSIDAALGVGLPPTSLMRARTIGQISKLIAEHMGESAAPAAAPVPVESKVSTEEVDLTGLSDDDIAGLLDEPEKTEEARS